MADQHRQFLAGLRVTSMWTMTSRVLGMVRDMATAALLGLTAGGVMDAFVVAFRIPNLFRRLFGEGALAASYLPVLTGEFERDRASAWCLASVTLTWLAAILAAIVVLAEAVCALLWLVYGNDPHVALLLGLAAVMMPYLFFICLASQMAATLHALNHFSVPAFVPVVLNLTWIVGALWLAPAFSTDKQQQAYVLAVCVLCAGVLQLLVQVPVLRALGFRYDYNWQEVRGSLGRVVAAMLPMVLGLAVTQINTLLDSLIAWGFSSPKAGQPIQWLGGLWDYPMRQGATAAIYFGERLYQLPVGILGITVATVIFPLLSRHAARGDHRQVSADLSLGLRLVLFLAVPAAVGLVLLAEPLARLLFERGEFTAADTARTAHMIRCYAVGVWAYCALPVLVRGFYACGKHAAPVRIGTAVVMFNTALNLILIWPLAEAGLAVATATAAALHVLWLAILFDRSATPLDWHAIAGTMLRSAVAVVAMTIGGLSVMWLLPPGDRIVAQLVHVFVPLVVCMVLYLGTYTALGGDEWKMLVRRPQKPE